MSNNTRSVSRVFYMYKLTIEDKSKLCADLGGTGRPAGGGGGLQTSLLENSNFLNCYRKMVSVPPPPPTNKIIPCDPLLPFFFEMLICATPISKTTTFSIHVIVLSHFL